MKKKFFVFLFIFIAIFSLSGCYTPFTDINDILDNNPSQETTQPGGGSSGSQSTTTWPKSSQSLYQSPVEIKEGATETEIVESYLNSTVTVFVKTSHDADVSFGSGICIYSGGYIITNYHVVTSAISNSTYKVSVVMNQSTTEYAAKILWSDLTLDLAIIQCTNGDIPYAKMADRVVMGENKLRLLEKVITIGTPIDFSLQNSCSVGYVSGMGRFTYSDTNIYETLIQHTAPISNGNSGGPLFDMEGNLVGLNTLGASQGNSIYFAIPIYPIMTILERVVTLNEQQTPATYKTPTIGISLSDYQLCQVTEDIEITDKGVYITAITKGTGAEGVLNVGDYIIKAKVGTTTYNIETRNDLLFAILKCNKNDTITFTIKNSNGEKTVDLVLS